jgi:hypothetical protein
MDERQQKRLEQELRRRSDTLRLNGDVKTADLIVRAIIVLERKRNSPLIAKELISRAAGYEQQQHKTYLVAAMRQAAVILRR